MTRPDTDAKMDVLFIDSKKGGRVHGADYSRGVGGAASAVILSAEILAAHGHSVTVASDIEGRSHFGGVQYVPYREAVMGGRFDAVVMLNRWDEVTASIPCERRVYLHYDTSPGGGLEIDRCFDWADSVTVQSEFGRDRLLASTHRLDASKVRVIPIPIRLGDYPPGAQKIGKRLIYTSMADRGLEYLAQVFPAIRRKVPDAELHITGDFTMYGQGSQRGKYAKLFEGVPGVHYHGAISRASLVELQQSALVLAFPCTFPEGFCIAAAEAMAAGAVPVTSDAFALHTTVGPAGVLIRGHPGGGRRRAPLRWWYLKRFTNETVRLLQDERYYRRKAAESRQHVEVSFSPARWYEQFLPILAGEEGRGVRVAGGD